MTTDPKRADHFESVSLPAVDIQQPETATPAFAISALDRAVMIASRRERNFAPELITVTLHTTETSVAIEGRPYGPTIPAPDWPELPLPTYRFSDPTTGRCATTDLETFLTVFTEAFARETTRPDGRLILTAHADVLGDDFDDAYAWSYDPHAKDFQAVPPADAADLFHEDTHLLAFPWHKAHFRSVSALAPADPAR
ncbi:hypothetical protein ACH4UR_25500 [Streptomyces lydicus]|uniref:hypothetical protein n=1 Tax=Streptomyces lydicus TaxID=47763 RepID=UPI0034088625